jgi:hypothetical protein
MRAQEREQLSLVHEELPRSAGPPADDQVRHGSG